MSIWDRWAFGTINLKNKTAKKKIIKLPVVLSTKDEFIWEIAENYSSGEESYGRTILGSPEQRRGMFFQQKEGIGSYYKQRVC